MSHEIEVETGAQHAWVSLVSLCGCNHKQAVRRGGKSVYVRRPLGEKGEFRLDAARFDAGECQFRDGWTIRRWGDLAEEACGTERDWQI